MSMPKSKWSAFFSLLVVFLSGAVVGALAHRLYMVTTAYSGSAPAPKRPDPEEVRKRITADLRAKVHLDDQQVAELNRIMDETRDTFRKMHDQMNTDVRALHDRQWQKFRAELRPDQQPLYDKWRADRDAEQRKRHEQQQQKQGGIAPRQ
jgi:uncharacterized coiled-coil protein SlyX